MLFLVLYFCFCFCFSFFILVFCLLIVCCLFRCCYHMLWWIKIINRAYVNCSCPFSYRPSQALVAYRLRWCSSLFHKTWAEECGRWIRSPPQRAVISVTHLHRYYPLTGPRRDGTLSWRWRRVAEARRDSNSTIHIVIEIKVLKTSDLAQL